MGVVNAFLVAAVAAVVALWNRGSEGRIALHILAELKQLSATTVLLLLLLLLLLRGVLAYNDKYWCAQSHGILGERRGVFTSANSTAVLTALGLWMENVIRHRLSEWQGVFVCLRVGEYIVEMIQ